MATEADIDNAVRLLKAGGLVAIPTETVYGLAADALNPAAVRKIFGVKGRPPSHPLIVHVGRDARLEDWAAEVPPAARRLAERFWPGPLTMVLKRNPRVPLEVTGGQETVALRMPAHPVTLELLKRLGGGLAAPSANRFGQVSPTTAQHVRDDLGRDVELVLDGGPCTVGVESTIVDLSGDVPSLLRPGGVSREQLAGVLGTAPVAPEPERRVRTPGMLESHYAPRARVRTAAPELLEQTAAEELSAGRKTGVWTNGSVPSGAVRFPVGATASERAASLYAMLREADALGLDVLVLSLPDGGGLDAAVADRLSKAAAPRP